MSDLVPLSKVDRALMEAKTLPELVNLRALVRSAVDHAKRIRVGNREEYNEYVERELRIARRAGKMLAKMEKHPAGRPSENRLHDVTNLPPTLSDLSITKMQSARWQLVGRIPENQFESWLAGEKKAKRALTFNGLYNLARQLFPSSNNNGGKHNCKIVTDLQSLIDDGCKFGCIYADPPWSYDNRGTRSNVEKEYKATMTVNELCAEPIGQLAADTCHLHLWVTVAFTFEAKRLLDAWGFEFKSEIIWCKSQMGIGNYWRLSHEKMLLGTRGNSADVVFQRGQKNHKSWLETKRGKHSNKPDAFRALVEKVSPGPYLELYGRHRIPDWVVYGNDVEAQTRIC